MSSGTVIYYAKIEIRILKANTIPAWINNSWKGLAFS